MPQILARLLTHVLCVCLIFAASPDPVPSEAPRAGSDGALGCQLLPAGGGRHAQPGWAARDPPHAAAHCGKQAVWFDVDYSSGVVGGRGCSRLAWMTGCSPARTGSPSVVLRATPAGYHPPITCRRAVQRVDCERVC